MQLISCILEKVLSFKIGIKILTVFQGLFRSSSFPMQLVCQHKTQSSQTDQMFVL